MKKVLAVSFVSLIAMLPAIAGAAPSATSVALVNDGAALTPTQRMATTSYVQGAYNTLGTQINNVIADSTVPVPANETPYAVIDAGNSVSENLVALDGAIVTATGSLGETYVTKASAVVTPVDGAMLNYLNETTAGTNVGTNLGILDNQVKTNADAIAVLNGDAETAGSVANAIAAEVTRATTAESALSDRIGTLAEDGRYIIATDSVSANLAALDAQVEINKGNIGAMSALSSNGVLTGDSRTSLVSAINALDVALSNTGSVTNVAEGHYIGTNNGKNSVSANLTALDDQVYANSNKLGNDIATMGTTADTVTGAIKEMHAQTIQVATTWGSGADGTVQVFTVE